MEYNVTNRLLAEILMARRRGEAPSYGWPEPRTQQPEPPPYIMQQAQPDPHWTSRLAEPRDFESSRPHGLRAAEDWSRSPRTTPAWPSPNFDNFIAPERAQQAPPEPCFDNPEHTSISTKKGHQFCTRFGAFSIFPTDPATGIQRYSSEGSFMGRAPDGTIRNYPGGAIISVAPDGTVTVDSDI